VLDGETQFVLKVDQPELWSAETPVLYDLLLEVTAEDGTVQELIPQRVGFRRFEMKDQIMMLTENALSLKASTATSSAPYPAVLFREKS